jgi:hypothetical protein
MKEIKAKFLGRNPHDDWVWNFMPENNTQVISLVLGSQQMSCFPNPEPKIGDMCKLRWDRFGGYNGWIYSGMA